MARVPLAALGVFLTVATFFQAEAQTKPKPPVKPPTKTPPPKTAPTAAKPKADPYKAVFEQARAIVLKSQKEYEETRKLIRKCIVEDESMNYSAGTKYYFSAEAANSFGQYLTGTYEKHLKELQDNYDQANAGKMKPEDYFGRLYNIVFETCQAPWTLWRSLVFQQAQMLQVAHTIRIGKIHEEIEKAGYALRGGTQAQFDALQARRVEMIKEAVNGLAPQVRALGQTLADVRRRWCPEHWRWYEISSKRKAVKNDIHERMSNYFMDSLNSQFGDRGKEAFNLLEDRHKIQTNAFYWGADSLGRQARVSYDFIKAKPFPDLDPKGEGVFSFGAIFTPAVAELKDYVELEASAEISEAFVVPTYGLKLGPDNKPAGKARIDEAKDEYVVFVFGPKLPTKKADLKSLVSDDPSVKLEVIGFMDEIDDVRDLETIQHWAEGNRLFNSGLDSEELKFAKTLPRILLRARVGPGVLPGRKNFKLNGADGRWYLTQGTISGRVRVVRDKPDAANGNSTFEPTDAAYLVDRLRFEVQLEKDTNRPIGVTLSRNGRPVLIDGKQEVPVVSAGGGIYRSAPIEVLQPSDFKMLTGQGKEPGMLYVAANGDDVFHVDIADPKEFRLVPSRASFRAILPRESPWKIALKRAAGYAGKKITPETPEAQIESFSNIILTEAIFYATPVRWVLDVALPGNKLPGAQAIMTTKITLADHAAMLLLREQFIDAMKKIQAQLPKITDEESLRFFKSTVEKDMGPNNPLGRMKVTHPRPKVDVLNPDPKVELYRFFDPVWLQENTDRQERENRVLFAVKQGFEAYAQAIDYSIKKAVALKETDIEGLLELTGNNFKPVADILIPKLMKPDGIQTRTRDFHWIPDAYARGKVNGIVSKFDELKSQREYSEIDTQVAICVASLVPILAPANLARSIFSLGLSAVGLYQAAVNETGEYLRREEEYQFAAGASALLGTDRWDSAQMQRTQVWSVLLNLAAAGIGLKADVFDLMAEGRKFLMMQAAARGIEKLGGDVTKIATLAAEEQAGIAFVAARAEAKQSKVKKELLSKLEQEAGDVFTSLKDKFGDQKNFKFKKIPERTGRVQLDDFDPANTELAFIRDTGAFVAADGTRIPLGKHLGEGAFFSVYEVEINGQRYAMKFAKHDGYGQPIQTEWKRFLPPDQQGLTNVHPGNQVMADIMEGIELAKANGINHLDVRFRFDAEQPYMLQPIINENDNLRIAGKISRYSEGQSKAILDLFDGMKKKGLVWLDPNRGNILLQRGAANTDTWVAKIVDADYICEWGKLNERTRAKLMMMETRAAEQGVTSMKSAPKPAAFSRQGSRSYFPDLDAVWEKHLESCGWIGHDGANYYDKRLLVSEVEKRFGKLRQRNGLDLSEAPFKEMTKAPERLAA